MGVPDGLRDARAGRYAIQYLSPGWLRIDPTFDPLRGHPRFRKLVDAML
jgi:hypothetical protein